jgi:hypothetical protein
MRGCGETDERLDGSLSVRSLSSLSSFFFPFISIGGPIFLGSGTRGTGRAGTDEQVCVRSAGDGVYALPEGWRQRCRWIGYFYTRRFLLCRRRTGAAHRSHGHCWVYVQHISLSHSAAYCVHRAFDGRDGSDAFTAEEQRRRHGHRASGSVRSKRMCCGSCCVSGLNPNARVCARGVLI